MQICHDPCRHCRQPWGLGDARHQGATPVLGGVCPSTIVPIRGIFAILVPLMPVTILAHTFALPDAIVMAHFVRSARVVVRDVAVCSCCTQHWLQCLPLRQSPEDSVVRDVIDILILMRIGMHGRLC
jgi:hypothetical protein